MTLLKASDIPEMSDSELEELLNTTIVELIPGETTVQSRLYHNGVCIVADLLDANHEILKSIGPASYRTIGKAMRRAVQSLCERRA